MNQRAYVLQRLRESGSAGIHTFQLRGEYIGNPSERVRELVADGYGISATRERPAPGRALGVRYVLTSDVGVGDGSRTSAIEPTVIPGVQAPRPGGDSTPPAVAANLFDTGEYAQRLSVYDREAA
jgi:hypothetical protein